MDLLFFVSANLLMLYTFSRLADCFFSAAGGAVKLVRVVVLSITQITLVVLLSGLFIHRLAGVWLTLLSIVVSALLLLIQKRTGKKRPYAGLFVFRSVIDLWNRQGLINRTIILLTVFQILTALYRIFVLPPLVWDVYTYHLPPVMEWLNLNKIPMLIDMPVDRVNYFPLGWKLINLWFVSGTGSRLAELPQLLMAVMIIPTVYGIMKEMNVAGKEAVRYSCLTFFIPSVMMGAVTCQDHIPLTAMTFITVALLMRAYRSCKYSDFILLAMSAGILGGIKITGLKILAVLFFVSLIMWKGRIRLVRICVDHWKRIIVFAGITALLCTFWYLKNYINYGSFLGAPVSGKAMGVLFFVFAGLFIWYLLPAPGFTDNRYFRAGLYCIVSAAATVTIIRFWPDLANPFTVKLPASAIMKNILHFVHRIRDIGGSYTPDLGVISGFGIQFFSFGLTAFITVFSLQIFRKVNRQVRLIFWFSTVLLLMYFLYYYSHFNYRLFGFFAVSGLILWSYLSDRFIKKGSFKTVSGLMVVGMIIYNMLVCFPGHLHEADKWKSSVKMNRYRELRTSDVSSLLKGQEWQYINEYIGAKEGIAYWGGRNSWVLPYYEYPGRKVVWIKKYEDLKVQLRDGRKVLQLNDGLLKWLKSEGISYLHINDQGCWDFEMLVPEKTDKLLHVAQGLYYIKYPSYIQTI